MATLVLGAVGAAVGGSIGGSVLGVSAAVAGRAVGATLGRMLDQRVLGQGSAPVEHGKVDRFRLSSASEGKAVARVYGRFRVSAQVIWSSQFLETRTTTAGGGKGSAPSPSTVEYSYSVSLALAICDGPIEGIGRIWADGVEIAKADLNMVLYKGDEGQTPDPTIESIEGIGNVPAYRGLAYAVLENLDLGKFGNRVPQLSFEVKRAAQPRTIEVPPAPRDLVRGIAMIPGTGEYSYATEPVFYAAPDGSVVASNVNTSDGRADFVNSLEDATESLPELESVLVVSSWFGDDLRAGACTIKPKVEQRVQEGSRIPWTSGGLSRLSAEEVARDNGRSVYGGTPSDAALIEGIRAIKDGGKRCVFYPFILMEILEGNDKPDPWNPGQSQPKLPWRGRITSDIAPGLPGSPDGTLAAETAVDQFYGQATAADFDVSSGAVVYSGPSEWCFARYILHNAAVCAAAGGVDAFCIGSELRGLTQIRGANHSFPFVQKLMELLTQVRVLLPNAKLGYASDWSEYFGYHSPDGNVYFHLDPLWSHEQLDFIGIDNYMPISDWRDTADEADADVGSIYNLNYLKSNIEGGEGFDWYYPTPEARDAQRRDPITDGAFDEPWVFRYKDIRNWWQLTHHNRIDGVRSPEPTAWVPRSKPIWFTEVGCAAIDKGTNQPNVFLDSASSESRLPHYSDGQRDDFIQARYLQAMLAYWNDANTNPTSDIYEGRMIDVSQTHVWAWDARPWPAFPNSVDVWADGGNYDKGHWLNGRIDKQPLASVIADICETSGLRAFDVSGVHGLLTGTAIEAVQTARSDLQPILMAFGIEALESDGRLVFRMRSDADVKTIEPGDMVAALDGTPALDKQRLPLAENAGRVRVEYADGEASYEVRVAEATLQGEPSNTVSSTDLPLALSPAEAQGLAERARAEVSFGRTSLQFGLAPSRTDVSVGDLIDVVQADDVRERYRVDRIQNEGARRITASRHDTHFYTAAPEVRFAKAAAPFVPMVPIAAQFMDLPIFRPDQNPVAPFLACSAKPWPGGASVYGAGQDAGYSLIGRVGTPATMGRTLSALPPAMGSVWDNGPALTVQLTQGVLNSVSKGEVLAGANALAIGDGSTDRWEIFQFAEARLIAPNTYDLVTRLRGMRGTEHLARETWDEGSRVVLLSSLPEQTPLPEDMLGLERHFRIGPSGRAFDDPTYQHQVQVFDGIGLRPFAPVHLKLIDDGQEVRVTWIRRSREGGDRWTENEVPLAEVSESYRVIVEQNGQPVFTAQTTSPALTLPSTVAGGWRSGAQTTVRIAQISDRFGPGLEGVLTA